MNSTVPPPPPGAQPASAINRARISGEPDAELLQAVLQKAGITAWDVFIVGDGSGCRWDSAAGWAYALVDRETRLRKIDWGAVGTGSINFAETMPYCQAINWYDQVGGGKQMLKRSNYCRVHVLTDSEVVATWGGQANAAGPLPRKHAMFWAGIREMRRLGYHFEFHWAPRITTQMNWAADLIAGLARRELIATVQPSILESFAQQAARAIGNIRFDISPYTLNPDEEMYVPVPPAQNQ